MDIPPLKALLFMKGHSERVPGKNMRPLCGRPLFHWIVEQLAKSEHISAIIINTDSEEIARSATDHFDVTIHMRPDYLLDIQSDEAYQIMAYDLTKTDGEHFLNAHSTTPLLRAETIDQAIETFFDQREHDSLFSVTPIQSRFYWPDGKAINHDPDALIKTQNLSPIYEENSCIYIFSRAVFTERKNRIGQRPLMFPMDSYEAVDIDDMIDFDVANALMAARLKGTRH